MGVCLHVTNYTPGLSLGRGSQQQCMQLSISGNVLPIAVHGAHVKVQSLSIYQNDKFMSTLQCSSCPRQASRIRQVSINNHKNVDIIYIPPPTHTHTHTPPPTHPTTHTGKPPLVICIYAHERKGVQLFGGHVQGGCKSTTSAPIPPFFFAPPPTTDMLLLFCCPIIAIMCFNARRIYLPPPLPPTHTSFPISIFPFSR